MPDVIRRDSKGRKLWTGESQEKNGRYKYRYIAPSGERKSVYSWRLTESDAAPKGRRKDASLREKEKQIQKAFKDCVMPDGGNITVLELVEKYVSRQRGVKHNTRANYNFVMNIIKKDPFGMRRIGAVRISDAKEWLIKL